MDHFNSSCGPESSSVMLSVMPTAKGPMPSCMSVFLSMKRPPGSLSQGLFLFLPVQGLTCFSQIIKASVESANPSGREH